MTLSEGRSFPAKVLPPRLHGAIYSRQPLHERLAEELEKGVVWLTGPPGAGKTTLAIDFLRSESRQVLWYQMDVVDTDPSTFFSYLCQAVEASCQVKSGDLPRFQPENMAAIDLFSRRFFRELYTLAPPLFLVFDNYQEVPEDSPVQSIVLAALEEMQGDGRVMIISRKGPPPLFARMQLNGELSQVGNEDLSFTVEEVGEFFRVRGVAAPHGKYAEMFHGKTRGWVAGLILLEEGMEAAEESAVTVDDTSHQAVFDYFAGEILLRESAECVDILLHAALFREIDPQILEQMGGLRGVENCLGNLARRNYFTYTLSQGKKTLFRFHPLFREFLLSMAEERMSPERLTEIRRQAAETLCATGDSVEGIDLLFSCGDWEKGVPMLKGVAAELFEQGRYGSILRWLEKLPVSHFSDPWLLYLQGMATVVFDPPKGIDILERSFDCFRDAGDLRGAVKACSSIINAGSMALSDLHKIDRWLDLLLSGIGPARLSTETDPEAPALIESIYHGLVLRKPDHPDIETWNDLFESRVKIGSSAALHHLWSGRFTETEEALNFLTASDRYRTGPLFCTVVTALRLNFCLFTGEYDRGIRTAEEGLAAVEKSSIVIWKFHLLANAAACCLGKGDLAGAESYLRQALANSELARPFDLWCYHLARAWQSLLTGDPLQARHHTEVALGESESIGAPFAEVLSDFFCGLAAIFLHRQSEAEQHLQRSLALSQKIYNNWTESMARLGLAYLYLQGGDDERGEEELAAGLALSSKHGYTTFCFDTSDFMSRICMWALEKDVETDFVGAYIRRHNLTPVAPLFHLPQWPWPVKIHTLGRFSIEIHGEELSLDGKSLGKPLELLMVLIALGGRQVPEGRLADTLWPDADGDRQISSLKTTLHRSRKLLGVDGAVQHRNNSVTLNPELCWLDSWAFLHLAEQLEEDLKKGPDTAATRENLENGINLYRGVFMANRPDDSWTFDLREQLRRRFQQLVLSAGRLKEEKNQWDTAVSLYQQALESDSLCEQLYHALMLCHHAMDRNGELINVYRQYKRAAEENFAFSPSPAIKKLYHEACRSTS